MMIERISPSERILPNNSLVIVNPRSGEGKAPRYADQLEEKFNHQQVILNSFLAYAEEMSSIFTFFIVLGGDGSQASVIRSLLAQDELPQHQLPQPWSVLLPGVGGEKVFAKSLGTNADPASVLRRIKEEGFGYRRVQPLSFTYTNSEGLQETQLAAWNVIGGLSNNILGGIEINRSKGMSDFQRRLAGLLAGIKQLKENPQYVYITLPNGEQHRVIDAGVTSGSLPFWTSHFNFGAIQPAIIHYIGAGLDLERDFQEIARGMILDFIANSYYGIPRKNPMLERQILNPGETVVISAHADISCDSEIAKGIRDVKVTIPDPDSYPQVNMVSAR